MIILPNSPVRETTYDVVVIGSGPAGLSFTEQLVNLSPSIRVCILESGGFQLDPSAQKLNLGEFLNPVINEKISDNRARMFGGTSSMWGGESSPLTEDDFEEKPYFEVSGWPISLDDLRPYYYQAADYLNLKGYNEERPKSSELLPLGGTGLTQKIWWYSSPVARLGDTRREALAANEQIDIWLNSTAIGLLNSSRKVTAVRVHRDLGLQTLRARVVVLAAGGIENPRCLLNWKESNPELTYETLNIGRFFAVHPYFTHQQNLLLFGKNHDSLWYRLSETSRKKLHITLSEEIRAKNHWENITLMLWKPNEANANAELSEKLVNSYGPSTMYNFNLMCEMRLDPRSQMKLMQTRDNTGLKGIQISAQVHPNTPKAWIQGLNYIIRALGEADVGRVRLGSKDRISLEYLYTNGTWGAHHHMCATRMSPTPSTGVVDENCLIHGTENLYVLGASTFGTASMVNPTFTVVALAMRAAKHVAGFNGLPPHN